MVRKLNLNTPPGWARLTRLSLSNWSWKRRRAPGEYTQSMRLWDHGHEKSCSPLCWGCWTSVKAVLPHPFREKQGQETEIEGTADIWSLGTRFSSPLHWQLGTLIPKHILLFASASSPWIPANVTKWQIFWAAQPMTSWPWLYILPPRISFFLKNFWESICFSHPRFNTSRGYHLCVTLNSPWHPSQLGWVGTHLSPVCCQNSGFLTQSFPILSHPFSAVVCNFWQIMVHI